MHGLAISLGTVIVGSRCFRCVVSVFVCVCVCVRERERERETHG